MYVRINFKLNMLMIKHIMKLGIIVIIQKNIGTAYCICNLNYSLPK